MKALALVALVACGPGPGAWQKHILIKVTSVDHPLYRTFDDLLTEAEIEANATLYERGEGGYRVIQDTAYIAARAATDGATVGNTTEDQRIIVPQIGIGYKTRDGQWIYLPEGKLKDVLAHELGHAMGLAHTDHGLMESGNWECVGTEAKCLVAALREQGALPALRTGP